MTETADPTVIAQALTLIDDGLGTMMHRELVSSDEVTDLLLDVRTLLTNTESAEDRDGEQVPVPG